MCNLLTFLVLHCVKSVRIRNYSGPHFPAFGLNTERYGVSLRIQSECGKMRTRITLHTYTFHAVLFIVGWCKISTSRAGNSRSLRFDWRLEIQLPGQFFEYWWPDLESKLLWWMLSKFSARFPVFPWKVYK